MEDSENQQDILLGLGVSSNRQRDSKNIGAGKWIELNEIVYAYGTDEDGKEKLKKYEILQRTTRPKGSAVDGCSIIALLKEKERTHLIVCANYRPPIDRYVLEFAGGNINYMCTVLINGQV